MVFCRKFQIAEEQRVSEVLFREASWRNRKFIDILSAGWDLVRQKKGEKKERKAEAKALGRKNF